jgi:hypothetical protein
MLRPNEQLLTTATMKPIYLLLAVAVLSCTQPSNDKSSEVNGDTVHAARPLPAPEPAVTRVEKTPDEKTPPDAPAPPRSKSYANERFRNVTVQKTGEHKYTVKGEGQIFEANFGWVVEDGHDELLSGHQITDAGAPEWGAFSFVVEVKNKRPASTLHLVLYETSAKYGSRQHQLPILLE